jgi:anti-anti-sigma factor
MGELSEDSDIGMSFDLVEEDGTSAVVKVSGELDIGNIDDLEAAVAPIVKRKPERLVIDASGLRFADTSAIAAWVRWATQVSQVEIREPPTLLRRVIETMGLGETLQMRP